MKRTNAQRFLIAGGITALLSGGSCFIAIGLGSETAILFGIGGLGGFFLAAILCLIGLIGLLISRRAD